MCTGWFTYPPLPCTIWNMPEVIRICPVDADALWTALSDVESWPVLLPSVSGIRRTDRGFRFAAGARYRVRQPWRPVAEYVVTDVSPGLRFTWATRTRLLTTVVTRRIRRGVHASILTLRVDWSGPLAPVAGLVLSGPARRALRREARALERVAGLGRVPTAPEVVR
jgi:Polyketide cyclase / dehydrase and lipid transport